MADVVAQSTQPALGAIKLAWWRERLEELDQGKIPAEPRLQAAAAELVSRGVSGSELAKLEEAWAALLEEAPNLDSFARSGVTLFRLGSKLLGGSHPLIVPAGRLYAFQNAVRRGLIVLSPSADLTAKFPRALRPLTALASLAARDALQGRILEPEATPARAWTVLRHRLTGRVSYRRAINSFQGDPG